MVLLSNLMKDPEQRARATGPLFWSPQFHGPLPPIGDVGRPKYNGLELWRGGRRDDNKKGAALERTLLSYDEDETIWHSEKKQQLRTMDQRSVSQKWERFEERDYTSQDECVRPAWTDLQFPVCNAFHELQTETVMRNDWRVRYLAHGYYRDSFLMEKETEEDSEADAFVWKRIRWKDSFDYNFGLSEQIRTEALVMERLSASPRTTHIYGYCATSLAVEVAHDITEDIVPFTAHQKERGRISQEKLEELQRRHKAPIFSFNNYTVTEKLDLSIAVAEAIAEMHGFDSVIANDDVHPDQWLVAGRSDGGRLRLDDIRLNDMNNARFLQFNPEKQEYCKVYSSYGGDFRAPEEYVGGNVDESVDIYPMANMIFSILTGLWPWYEIPRKRREDLQEKAIAGKRPFLNPLYRTNSLIEGRLVELMDMCYALAPSDRPDIFEVVRHLHQTKALHLEQQKQEEKEKR